MRGDGYRGVVTLRSPLGKEVITLEVPGRHKEAGKIETRIYWEGEAEEKKRQDRRFRRLLSSGWRVIVNNGVPIPQEKKDGKKGKAGKKQKKKKTDLVVGSSERGNQSHGGKHASAEVENSPNAAAEAEGKRQRKKVRGKRSGQKRRRREKSPSSSQHQEKIHRQDQGGGSGVYAPTPIRVNPDLLKSAEKSAELLAEMIGRSGLKVQKGVTVNAEDLLIALETSGNPLPPLEDPDERPKMKILVSPDHSGSTQGWSGLGKAWALHLSHLPEVDVFYIENFNGEFLDLPEEEVKGTVESSDMILYLGDLDGYDRCKGYASHGAIVLGLDQHRSRISWGEAPNLRNDLTLGNGRFLWVDRVSAFRPETWVKGVEILSETLG